LHSSHHRCRADHVDNSGSSAGDSRAASTAYGFRTPVVLARWPMPIRAAPAMSSAACTAPTPSASPRISPDSPSEYPAGGAERRRQAQPSAPRSGRHGM